MNLLRERYHFHHRQQKLHETIEDFALELRRLASSCQFNELEESLVRDHLLFGLRDESFAIEIIDGGGDPSVEDVIQFCMVLDKQAWPTNTEEACGKKQRKHFGKNKKIKREICSFSSRYRQNRARIRGSAFSRTVPGHASL